MLGPKILADSMILREGSPKHFKFGNKWQYHSRSDHHSKIACWGLMLDLLLECSTLRSQAEEGLIGFGLNHEMRDFGTDRKKNLDLVICRPRSESVGDERKCPTFQDRVDDIGVHLDREGRDVLSSLPVVQQVSVGAVHVAVEAKACMTAHVKSLPRLYDELNSSHQAIHGNSPHALAVGLVLINNATEFISPSRNQKDLSTEGPIVSRHTQPQATERVVKKLSEIRRRARIEESGFDALGITVIECINDGSPVEIVEARPAPQPGDIYHYDAMVQRLVHLYEQRFGNI